MAGRRAAAPMRLTANAATSLRSRCERPQLVVSDSVIAVSVRRSRSWVKHDPTIANYFKARHTFRVRSLKPELSSEGATDDSVGSDLPVVIVGAPGPAYRARYHSTA